MKELLNYRYYVLIALTALTMTMLLGECPEGEDLQGYLQFHATHKIIGSALAVVLIKAYEYWNIHNRLPLISKLAFTLKRLTDERD